jgi:hypothetical protein
LINLIEFSLLNDLSQNSNAQRVECCAAVVAEELDFSSKKVLKKCSVKKGSLQSRPNSVVTGEPERGGTEMQQHAKDDADNASELVRGISRPSGLERRQLRSAGV